MRITKKHFANSVGDLLTTPELWYFEGKGNHIKTQADKIKEHLDGDDFTVEFSPDPQDENFWRHAKIISLRKKETSHIDLQDLAEKLKAEHGIQVCWFSPRLIPGFDEIAELARRPYSREGCSCFFDKLKKFQAGPASTYLLEMLTLPEVFNGDCEYNETTFNRQRDYFIESAYRQEVVRILIDITMSAPDIDRFINAFLHQTDAPEAS